MLSGVLLACAWPTGGFAPLVFVAWIPLLWVEDYVLRQQNAPNSETDAPGSEVTCKTPRPRYHLFFYAFSAFLVWNVLTTWWVWNSTPAATLAFIANAALMAGVFTLFHYSCRHFFKQGMRYILLFIYWLAFEFFHLHWDLSWPWLTLGYVFADMPGIVQWYEITGPLGGSLWVLACNVALFLVGKSFCKDAAGTRLSKRRIITAACLIFLPMAGSLVRYATYKEQGQETEVVVVQPNIDPYHEQFFLSPTETTQRMLQLAQGRTTPQTRFIVTPESMIQEYVWEDELPHSSASLKFIHKFLQENPNLRFVAGISSFTHVAAQDSSDVGVRRLRYISDPDKKFYKAHNSVISVSGDFDRPIPIHHKSRLTPGIEIMPFAGKVKFIEKLAVDLGGTVGTLGVDKGPHVFADGDTMPTFSDIICYESVFPDYVASCVNAGAELLFVSTNDGWWGDTPGHRQHAAYARLRAIENRRDIARSANTGISCFINQRGDVSQATEYWQPDCIRATLHASSRLTFYARYGEILGRCSLFMSLFFVLLTLIYRIFPQAWRDFRNRLN